MLEGVMLTGVSHSAKCAHCCRELVGVAVIFPRKPAVCGRADCLGWARAVALYHQR
jgi:hypothetical protein